MNESEAVRRPAVAGLFYPGDPGALAVAVDAYIAAAPDYRLSPRSIIAPHAGYTYSGAVAGTAYAAVRRGTVRRAVILGPPHRVPVSAFVVPQASGFATPLGVMPVDAALRARALAFAEVVADDVPHEAEHCIEVQLPFLQRLFGAIPILPVLVGTPDAGRVAGLIAALQDADDTLVVVSSDLSHYLPYAEARERDRAAATAIETLRVGALGSDQACGRHAIAGLTAHAAATDLRATTLDLRNSTDTAGGSSQGGAANGGVVGYGAWAFEDAHRARLDAASRQALIGVARSAIATRLDGAPSTPAGVGEAPWPLRCRRATFVTLYAEGRLRGCVGSVEPKRALIADVAANACRAAFDDPRFAALTRREVGALDFSISVLSHPRGGAVGCEAEAVASLTPFEDGVILRAADRQALFLPQVWEALPDPPGFLAELKEKAGLSRAGWPADARLYSFRAETFGARRAPPPAGAQ